MSTSPGFGLTLQSGPAFEPVVSGDFVNHARVAGADVDNGVVAGFILAAREYVEEAAHRQAALATWLMTLDQFPGRQVDDYRPPTWRYGIIRMPRPPLVSVVSVKYVDPGVTGGQPFALTTLDPSMYMVSLNTEPGRVAPSPFNVWPATNPLAFEAVQITFTCGYASAGQVPERLKLAIKLLAGHFYENREETREEQIARIPLGLRALISSCSPKEYR